MHHQNKSSAKASTQLHTTSFREKKKNLVEKQDMMGRICFPFHTWGESEMFFELIFTNEKLGGKKRNLKGGQVIHTGEKTI